MNHIDETLLNEYLDQQLDVSVREQVNDHLADCAACRERLAEKQQLFVMLKQVEEVPLMVDLSRQVVARLSAEFKPRPIPRWSLPIIAMQMVAALALFIWLWPSVQSFLEKAGQAISRMAIQLQPDLSFSQLINLISGFIDKLGEFGQGISPTSHLPVLEGFLIIGLALLFWLAGTGLVLRQSLTAPNET